MRLLFGIPVHTDGRQVGTLRRVTTDLPHAHDVCQRGVYSRDVPLAASAVRVTTSTSGFKSFTRCRRRRLNPTWRPPGGVRTGDEIQLTTPHGHLRYRVERTRIVDPDDLSVLDPLPQPSLTLITCFPFS